MYEQEKQVEALDVEREQRLRDVAEQEERELRALQLAGASESEMGRRRSQYAGRRAAIEDHYRRERGALTAHHAAQPGILGPTPSGVDGPEVTPEPEPLDAA